MDRFSCHLCSKSYRTETSIRLHLESSHSLSGSEIDDNIREVEPSSGGDKSQNEKRRRRFSFSDAWPGFICSAFIVQVLKTWVSEEAAYRGGFFPAVLVGLLCLTSIVLFGTRFFRLR